MKEPATVIRRLQVTEKGTDLQERHNQYLFEVNRKANKIEIARAVEELFKVSVIAVNTMNYQGKRKRERSMKYGRRSDWKRAVVTLKAGDSIEVN
jgi:large subunit ribosomal protein L23